MAKKFTELRTKMSPAAQSRAAARAEAMLLDMQLQDIRKSRNVTQIALSQAHGFPTLSQKMNKAVVPAGPAPACFKVGAGTQPLQNPTKLSSRTA